MNNRISLLHTAYDLSYMSRKVSSPVVVSETDWLDRLIMILEKFHFADAIKCPTQIVAYDTQT